MSEKVAHLFSPSLAFFGLYSICEEMEAIIPGNDRHLL